MQKYARITDLQIHKNEVSELQNKFYFTIIRVHRSVFSIDVYKSSNTTEFYINTSLFYRSVTTVQ